MRQRLAGAPMQAELRSTSTRLTAQFATLMALLLIVVLGLILVLFKLSTDAVLERDLEEASHLTTAQIAPSGIFVTVMQGSAVTVAPGQPAGLADVEAAVRVSGNGETLTRERTVGGRDYTTRTALRGDRIVQVTVEEHRTEESFKRLMSVLVVVGVAALGIAAVVSSVMARRAIRPMAEALATQRRFVADASHELRTPLTLLSTRAQLLSRLHRDGLPPDVAASLDELTRDSRTVTAILDDLLIAADPRSEPADDAVDLVAAADAVITSLLGPAEARKIVLERSGAAERAVIRGGESAIARLYTALISNALDYARTTVTVRVDVDGRTAVVTVSDDGPGFAPAVVPHAFEPFVTGRTAAADPASADHSGLGLAIVAEIARRHHGCVRIRQNGDGAAVVLHLPLAQPGRAVSSGRPGRGRRPGA